MSIIIKKVAMIEFKSNLFPVSHWKQLRLFAKGNERDPRGLFSLTDDKWETWPYAVNGTSSNARLFRFHFSRFKTFLKLYAKWYCYQMIIGKAGDMHSSLAALPAQLMIADTYISEHGFRSIDDIASSKVFEALWKAQIKKGFDNITPLPRRAVMIQLETRSFWRQIKVGFSCSFIVPPVAPHTRTSPSEFALDKSKLIPQPVIRQVTNKLGLHREKKELFTRFDHLRLCVLILVICLGRRIHEILLSPRGTGANGPLSRYPSKGGAPQGSLWFQFTPNKEGPTDKVFISPEWEDIALYCVRELIKYGDEIRHLAAPEERGLLILVSRSNSTKGRWSKYITQGGGKTLIEQPRREGEVDVENSTSGLPYPNFNYWLNGGRKSKGILAEWRVTTDGSADGPIYRLLTSYGRHTRQSALALDPKISPLTRQRDLNHRDMDMQVAYQHRLQENNDALLEKMKEGKLLGPGVEWLSELLRVGIKSSPSRDGFKTGRPSSMTPRMQTLVRNNPLFLQLNRVPCGICILPQGPGGCAEFLNCTSAGEGGCRYFMIDTSDVQMLHELDNKVDEERRLERESASAGREIQAQKRGILGGRTEELRDEAIRRASEETLIKLREIKSKIEENGL